MKQLQFDQETISQLQHLRYYHPHPRVQKKMEVLFLKSQNLPHKQIAQLAGVSQNTMLSYFSQYEQGGIKRLEELHFRKPQSDLLPFQSTIKEYFKNHPPHSVNEAVDIIEELTGIRRSPTRIRIFLISIGLEYRKVGMTPSKADPDAQEAFKKKSWNLD